MEEWAKVSAKDALIAEYSALRAEAVQRVSHQNIVLGWAIAFVGVALGVLLKFESGNSEPLLLKLLINPDIKSFGLLAVIAAGVATGVELLMTYWVYQLFMVFRIGNYLCRLKNRMESLLGTPDELKLFSWDSDSRGLTDVLLKPGEKHPLLVRFSLAVSAWAQPMSLFILAFFALGVMAISLWHVIFVEPIFSLPTNIFLLFIFLFLLVGVIVIGLLFIGLHKWLDGLSGLPHAALVDKKSGAQSDITPE